MGCDQCVYCDGSEPLHEATDKMYRRGYICVEGAYLVADLFEDYMRTKIRYCPMCGAALTPKTTE